MTMTLEEIELLLREVAIRFRTRDSAILKEEMAKHKRSFVAQNDQDGATRVWCLERILQVQEKYIEAFDHLQDGHFYAAWNAFERVEIEYGFLRRHLLLSHAVFQLDFIISKTHLWQALYPYRIFSSLEFIKKARKCTTCGQMVSLRKPCGHLVGEIYDGEMCGHEITEIDFTSISIVTNPHHKYTVLFPQGEACDSNVTGKYNPLIHLIHRLESPFGEWQTYWGKRAVERKEFEGTKNDAFCPCNSMQNFEECCFHKPELLVPWVHIEIGGKQDHQIPDFLTLESSALTM